MCKMAFSLQDDKRLTMHNHWNRQQHYYNL